MPFNRLAQITLAIYGLLSGAILCRAEVPATAPETRVVPAAREALGAVRLRLTADGGDAEVFQARVRWTLGRDAATLGNECIVARDHEKAAVVLVDGQGLPYCYMTQDLFLLFDADGGGQLRVGERGAPGVLLTTEKDQDRLQAFAYFRTAQRQSEIDIDPGAILAGFLAKTTRAARDEARGTWLLETEKARATVQLAPAAAGARPALRRLSVTAPGALVELSEVRLGERPALKVDVTRAAVEAAGLAARPVDLKELERLPLVVRADFATSPAERAAAETLARLLGLNALGRPAATAPARSVP
jgi:hypothetical protein